MNFLLANSKGGPLFYETLHSSVQRLMLYLIVIDAMVTPIDSTVPAFSSSNYALIFSYNCMNNRNCEMLCYL